MKTAAIHPKCISGQYSEAIGVRSIVCLSHQRKRRRSNGRRGLPLPHCAAPEAQCPEAPAPVDGAPRGAGVPRVLHIDADLRAATVLAALMMAEAQVVHVPTLAAARRLLASQIFSLVVLDPNLPDGDGGELLAALAATPLLVYAGRHPDWRGPVRAYLPKPWTTPRQLWTAVSGMLGMDELVAAGD
ncbi:MAG: hypothetical protein V4508_00420 [Pseudomonadota bacterium]